MATKHNISTNKFGIIEITATKDKYEITDNSGKKLRKFVRKAWEDSCGHVWVKDGGVYKMVDWVWGKPCLPIWKDRMVIGYEC